MHTCISSLHPTHARAHTHTHKRARTHTHTHTHRREAGEERGGWSKHHWLLSDTNGTQNALTGRARDVTSFHTRDACVRKIYR